MYPKKGIYVFLLCTLIYLITAKIIIDGGLNIAYEAISIELYTILVYIISPIYMIRYILTINKENIISLEIVMVIATFLSIMLYNIITIINYLDYNLITEAIKQNLFFDLVIMPAFKNATFTIIIFLLINIIMEKKINSAGITVTKKIIMFGVIYMILLTVYNIGADLVLELIKPELYKYTPENIYNNFKEGSM